MDKNESLMHKTGIGEKQQRRRPVMEVQMRRNDFQLDNNVPTARHGGARLYP